MPRIRIWEWPNVLALDAALIALFWQMIFAILEEAPLSPAAQIVLGLSVWLTYMADRLFDVAKHPLRKLHSNRHRFAKQKFRILWGFWFCILTIDIGIALTGLKMNQLQNGIILLLLCLLYTLLNQTLSKHFFPKEICVAMIYAGGIIIFQLPNSNLWAPAGTLTLLFCINCLMIGMKEQGFDAELKVRSMTPMAAHLIPALAMICAISLHFLKYKFALPIGLSLGALLMIQAFQKRLSIENFRIFADSVLIIGSIVAFFMNQAL